MQCLYLVQKNRRTNFPQLILTYDLSLAVKQIKMPNPYIDALTLHLHYKLILLLI